MRTIGVVTTSRADYTFYVPVLRQIRAASDLKLALIVSGMHLLPKFGGTLEEMKRDGFPVWAKVNSLGRSDSALGVAQSISRGVEGFAKLFQRRRPDILLVLGDRFDMYAAALAATPFSLPIAHIAGGAVSEGAIDEVFRHSITKMAHLHFVETAAYRERVIRMGEEPWRVTLSGSPSLDNLRRMNFMTTAEINDEFGVSIQEPFLLSTFHPVTRELDMVSSQIAELLKAVEAYEGHVIFTHPNADPAGRFLAKSLKDFGDRRREKVTFLKNFGTRAYFSLMNSAEAMLGNSSSGLIEAPSFGLPVVNIGNRQRGRLRARNVIDVENCSVAILRGLRKALSRRFRDSLVELENPYGVGRAAPKIVSRLRVVKLNQKLIMKRFHDC